MRGGHMNVLDYGITIEKNAMSFYQSLANKTSLLSLKNFFITLSHNEQDHLDLISMIKGNPGQEFFYQPEHDKLPRSFLGIVDDKGLGKLSKEEIDGFHQVLKNEEDTLEQYEELQMVEENKLVKALFQKIMEQEKIHLSVVKDLCVLVAEQMSWK
jgi:rubrerythrin